MRVTMLLRCVAMMRGGGETRHLAWVKALGELGVEVDVIAGRPMFGHMRHPLEGAATIIRSPYARDAVYRWQGRRGFGRLSVAALHADEELFCRAAWRHIVRRRRLPDIVHAHALHQMARLGRRDIPVVINLPGPPGPRYLADLRLADALVSDGWGAEKLPAIIGCPVDHVTKGVDSAMFTPGGPDRRAELGLDGKRVVITVSRLVPIKNVALLVDAFARARQTLPDLHLIVVGEGPERAQLEAQSAALGLGDAITFTGYVPQAETPPWYRSGDVFALPSDFDNSPNVVLEAMATGLPIVATDVGGLRHFVTPGRNGELVPKRDAAAMADALVALMRAIPHARAIGAANRDEVVSRFSWSASARQLRDVYQRVLSSRERRSATARSVSPASAARLACLV
jgi:glycosyltransferase involved in cell wall biosynthesis